MTEKIYVSRPFLPKKAEFDKISSLIWEDHTLTNNGPLVKRLEQELKKYVNAKHINLMTNGHMALEIAIKALEIKGEVITTPFTFASTAHAITLCGATPVFCDICEDDLNIDPEKIEELITEKTTAIIPVHVYGHPCNIEKINELAQKHNLKVIYDAAHTFGILKDGVSMAMNGDVSMLSFHATKLFHTIEGGALVYQDEKYTHLFNAYKNFGIEGEDKIDFVGGNAKMNEFQGAMGLSILPHVEELICERKAITEAYRKNLDGIAGIKYFTPEKDETIRYNYAYMPILIDEELYGKSRDDVYNELKEHNIYTRRYFWPIVTEFGAYKEVCKDVNIPVAKKAGSQVLCLPIYNGLELQDVDRICELLRANAGRR